MIFQRRFIPWNSEMKGFYPGGALPYITYTGMCRPTGSWFWSSWFRTGYNISNARKLQFCKQPFEIIQGQIAFKNTVQCVNKQTVILLLHPGTEYKKLAHFNFRANSKTGYKNWPISRTGYQFQGKFFSERGANLEFRAAHTHLKNTQVPPPPPGVLCKKTFPQRAYTASLECNLY